jgi:hypothetical protein
MPVLWGARVQDGSTFGRRVGAGRLAAQRAHVTDAAPHTLTMLSLAA